jgi:hypothetical protein
MATADPLVLLHRAILGFTVARVSEYHHAGNFPSGPYGIYLMAAHTASDDRDAS